MFEIFQFAVKENSFVSLSTWSIVTSPSSREVCRPGRLLVSICTPGWIVAMVAPWGWSFLPKNTKWSAIYDFRCKIAKTSGTKPCDNELPLQNKSFALTVVFEKGFAHIGKCLVPGQGSTLNRWMRNPFPVTIAHRVSTTSIILVLSAELIM